MDLLPSLVLSKIFNYLNFKDRIRCSLVCQNWRSQIVIDYEQQEKLFIHFNHLFPFNLKCSYSNDLIGYKHSIQIKSFKFLKSILTRVYFRNLKKLYIFNIEQFELNILNLGICVNYFQQLEQLSLNKLRLVEKTTLNLTKLKVLELKNVTINDRLDLNTINLHSCICWTDMRKIKFRFPTKLVNLEYKNSNLEFDQDFMNLEVLSYFSENGLTRGDFLEKLKKLTKLIVYSTFVEHDLKELNRQKNYYKLDNLQILSFGFVESTSNLSKFIYFPINHNFIYLLDKFKLKELADNYDKLDLNISFPLQIDFCSLIDNFKTIPDNFFKKFNQIHQVNVCWNNEDLIDQYESLIRFIEKCGFLYKLILNNCTFKQNFYDQLSRHSSIGQLEIKETELKIVNFQFLSKSTIFNLKIFTDKLPIELVHNVLLNANLKYFEFNKKNLKFLIKNYQNHYHLEIDNRFVNQFINSSTLIAFLKIDDKISHSLSFELK